MESRNDATILIPDTINFRLPLRKDSKEVEAPYKKIPKRHIKGVRISLPFKYYVFIYSGIPKEPIIYLPFSIKDNLLNIATKPRQQKYIVGAHGLHLKKGHIIENHNLLERIFNYVLSNIVTKGNIYHHVLNSEQKDYL